ncbi:MAG TPA: DUF6788 family protein [Longimicrobiales bacterium]|nr:DUF6788 family protein [Longimicrobiales bacterium]
MAKLSSEDRQRRLRACEQEYETIKARIREIGFICEGSLVTRWLSCGKPNCRCSRDPDQRHGPYYQLSWKEGGITVSRRLSPEHAQLYEEWIANRRRLEELTDQLRKVSSKAHTHLFRIADETTSTQNRPPEKKGSTT